MTFDNLPQPFLNVRFQINKPIVAQRAMVRVPVLY